MHTVYYDNYGGKYITKAMLYWRNKVKMNNWEKNQVFEVNVKVKNAHVYEQLFLNINWYYTILQIFELAWITTNAVTTVWTLLYWLNCKPNVFYWIYIEKNLKNV